MNNNRATERSICVLNPQTYRIPTQQVSKTQGSSKPALDFISFILCSIVSPTPIRALCGVGGYSSVWMS